MTRRQRLARRLRPHQSGLTLVELLLAVAITVVIAGFVLQGIIMTRQGFQRDTMADRRLHADAAITALGGLIEAAMPIKILAAGAKKPTVAFEGDGEALHFIALGNGFALPGGLIAVTLRRDRSALLAEVTPVRAGEAIDTADDKRTRRVQLLAPVTRLDLRYFGRLSQDGKAGWQETWREANTLPELVAITVEGDGAARQERVVPLRQR